MRSMHVDPARAPLALEILDEPLSLFRFAADADVPEWALRAGAFGSVTRTADELSVVCATDRVTSAPLPAGTVREDGWRAIRFVGPFALTEVDAGSDPANMSTTATPTDRKSTRLNSSHVQPSRMPSSA